MSFLSAQSKFALISLGHSVAQEIAKSRNGNGLETIRARQAHYIMWCKSKQVFNPVGPEPQWDLFISMYIKEVMTGVNYHNKLVLRSATCEGYAKAVNFLFKLRDYPPPVDLTDETGCTKTIIHNLDREENIAAKRSPLNDEIHAELLNMAKNQLLIHWSQQ